MSIHPNRLTGARRRAAGFVVLLAAMAVPAAAQDTPPQARQNPSPMVERTRAHERLPEAAPPGDRVDAQMVLARPVRIYVPDSRGDAGPARVLIHFHGAPYVAEHAAARSDRHTVAVVVNLGAGSSAYERPFSDGAALDSVLAAARAAVPALPDEPEIVLSAFSAGYGAVRAILREPRHVARIHGVVLLDGLHTAYVPDGRLIADGGAVDTAALAPFVAFAREAAAGRKAMLVTHSEIFPGTFASTTETSSLLLDLLEARRAPVLAWGPTGMQQLGEARAGRLLVLGFAGNSAPDHIDHLHGLPAFLAAFDGL